MSEVPRTRRVYDRERGCMVDATEVEQRARRRIKVSPLWVKSVQVEPFAPGADHYDADGTPYWETPARAREWAKRNGHTWGGDLPTASERKSMQLEVNRQRAAEREARRGPGIPRI